jgi:hypothetical protein
MPLSCGSCGGSIFRVRRSEHGRRSRMRQLRRHHSELEAARGYADQPAKVAAEACGKVLQWKGWLRASTRSNGCIESANSRELLHRALIHTGFVLPVFMEDGVTLPRSPTAGLLCRILVAYPARHGGLAARPQPAPYKKIGPRMLRRESFSGGHTSHGGHCMSLSCKCCGSRLFSLRPSEEGAEAECIDCGAIFPNSNLRDTIGQHTDRAASSYA